MFCNLARELSYRWSYTFCLCRPVWSPLATWGHVNLSLIKWDKIKNWVSWLCLPHFKRLIATRQLMATVLDGVEGTISNIPEGSFWQRVIRSGWFWLARRSLLSPWEKEVINSHCIWAPKSYQIRPTDFFSQRLFSAGQHEQCHSPKPNNMPGSQRPISEVFFHPELQLSSHFSKPAPTVFSWKARLHRQEGGALCCSAQELHGSCSLNTRHKEHGGVLFPRGKD